MPAQSARQDPAARECPAGARALAVISLPGLGSAAPLGGGCCAVAAEDAVRTELESWPGITVEALDPAAETVTVAIGTEGPDLLPEAAEALTDLGFERAQVTRIP